MSFKLGQSVRCVCPAHKSDPNGTHGKIGTVVGELDTRRLGMRYLPCYVVQVDGERYNALEEWLSPIREFGAAVGGVGKVGELDSFLGVTGKL